METTNRAMQHRLANRVVLAPPVNVSPLIRLGRWTALITGIIWGIHRHRQNMKSANAQRAYDAKMKPIRDAKLAKEKKESLKVDLLYLAEQANVPIPKDFHEKY